MDSIRAFTFADISEEITEDLPPLDRPGVDYSKLTPNQKQWWESGICYLPKFLPDHLIRRYSLRREEVKDPLGWKSATPYMQVPELREIGLHPPLMEVMKELIGDDMGMHLNLTGWVSTERNFHCDDILNPPFIHSWYAAVWMALADISPDSGPFQYVPASHRWPLVRRDKLFQFLPKAWHTQDNWPTLSQDAVAKCFEEEIARREAKVVTYLPKRGDVLIWHGRLAHRGSKPNIPWMPRRSLICHYSALSRRSDMPKRAEHSPGCFYFVLNEGTTLGDGR